MSKLIKLQTHADERGALTVIENCLPFQTKRIYFLHRCDGSIRGEHAHIKTKQALVCLSGSCDVYVNDGVSKTVYHMDSSDQCLLLEPEDWHYISEISSGAIILLLASENYDPDDYILEEPA